MNENPISITSLNDFIFCPMSIYFHMLYGETNNIQMQTSTQINGSAVHNSIDMQTYSTAASVLQGITVYSGKYGIEGKIDLYYEDKRLLVERKRQVKTIYDGYVFQLYAQCFCLREMGYPVNNIYIYSSCDNKKYKIALPENDPVMVGKFEKTIKDMKEFNMEHFEQSNRDKCLTCIYEPACDRSLK